MMKKEELLKTINKLNIKFIRLQFTDILGKIKNLALPTKSLINNLDDGIVFDGSAIDGFARLKEKEMYLKPDYNTFKVLPWRSKRGGRVARLICDIYATEKQPFAGGPRNTLKKVRSRFEELGYTMFVGPEIEFFLFQNANAGAGETLSYDSNSYFDLETTSKGGEVRKEIVLVLNQMGFKVREAHHEVAPGQHEISLRDQDVLQAADDIVTAKFVIKAVADRCGMQATFMPKPVFGKTGSGLHLHQSLFKNGENVFGDQRQRLNLSQVAKCYINGLLEHAAGLTAITNPAVNSYKRLVGGYEAPVCTTWSSRSRDSFLRTTTTADKDQKIELRNVDAIANPYLALASILQAGLDGIEKEREESLIDREQNYLPQDLNEALEELKKDEVIQTVLGEYIINKFITAKKIEFDVYQTQVHDWELERYLDLFKQNKIIDPI